MKLRQLWVVRGALVLAVTTPLAAHAQADRAAKEEASRFSRALVERIADATDGKLDEQDRRDLDALRGSDVDIVAALKKEYSAPKSGQAVDVVRNSVILQALQHLNTEKAKRALIDIACTEQPNAWTLGPRAVRALAEITDDPDELALTLRAPHPATRDAAAQALARRSLTVAAVDALARQLTATAERKIAALLEHYPRIGDLIDNSESVPAGVYWTPTEMARQSYIHALAHMAGGDVELHRRLANAPADHREPILLALGHRRVWDVRPELLKMARDAEQGFVRAQAVRALHAITLMGDEPLLRDLAENDPFKRIYVGGCVERTRDENGMSETWPVRSAAGGALRRLEKRKPARMRTLGAEQGQALSDFQAVYKQREAWSRLSAEQRAGAEHLSERDRLFKAYRDLIDRYPHTEVAAMSRLEIIHLYTTSDDMYVADIVYEDLLKTMACTEFEMQAHDRMGRHWLTDKKYLSGEVHLVFMTSDLR